MRSRAMLRSVLIPPAFGLLLFASGAGCAGETATPTPPPPTTPAADTDPKPTLPFEPALVNGDFSNSLNGWAVTGDAANFKVFGDDRNWGRWTLSTYAETGANPGDAAQGTLSQQFIVPQDAIAIRFIIHGGRGHFKLLDGGTTLYDVVGPDNNDFRAPISWDVVAHRGKTLTIVIEDSVPTSPWGFVSTSGFDVVRDRADNPLKNSDFQNGLNGWKLTGDAAHFAIFMDPKNWSRMTVTSYTRTGNYLGTMAQGTLYQDFVVPDDADALRFIIHGGHAFVRLYDGVTRLYENRGADTNEIRIPISWDLTPYRGQTLRLAIEDGDTGPYGYISTTGFDIIRKSNGP